MEEQHCKPRIKIKPINGKYIFRLMEGHLNLGLGILNSGLVTHSDNWGWAVFFDDKHKYPLIFKNGSITLTLNK